MTTVSDLLAGGGTYLKWETPGTSYTGTITDVTARQSRKYESTELAFWDDGSPQMQVLISLATDYRDGENGDDDGARQVSINLWSGQKKALIAACKAAGVSEPVIGMKFKATHTEGIGIAKSPRVFVYELTAGPSLVESALAVPPAPAPAAATATANPAETARALLAAGLSVAEVASSTGLPATTVQALANLAA